MEYTVIRKGRGFVYACRDKLYRQVKKEGTVRYLKCCMEPCYGSAKLQNGEFKLRVRLTLKYSTGRRCCSCTVFLLGINRVTAKTQKPYLHAPLFDITANGDAKTLIVGDYAMRSGSGGGFAPRKYLKYGIKIWTKNLTLY